MYTIYIQRSAFFYTYMKYVMMSIQIFRIFVLILIRKNYISKIFTLACRSVGILLGIRLMLDVLEELLIILGVGRDCLGRAGVVPT